ncbi:MAG: inorganic phosphate transporter [Stellaceae bacterium]
MADAALDARAVTGAKPVRPSLDKGLDPRAAIVFLLLLAGGVFFVAYSLFADVEASGAKTTTFLPYLLLFVALLTALGFEFVNGFHDTANAVATVIYTHSLPANFAVIWSGCFNFLGVLLSSGAVAFGIISLLPVELILQVGSTAGFAMVFALLIAAVIWNLGTWFLGLPVSSSHSLIGSIIGVGVANALARGQDGTSGVDWGQATAVGKAPLFSPVVGFNVLGNPRPAVTEYVAHHHINEGTYPSLAVLIKDIDNQVKEYGSLAKIPAEAVGNTRNDMYLTDEALRLLMKDKEADLSATDIATLNAYKGSLDSSTKFIPTWVKVAVAIALGLGNTIGWKRIVITVGEKIGKTHLTYGQGAAAELVAAGTIAAADMYGLPVSTTHVLSSGVAGTMAANGSGLQMSTLRNIALAWVLTLPAAMMLSGGLYILFLNIS